MWDFVRLNTHTVHEDGIFNVWLQCLISGLKQFLLFPEREDKNKVWDITPPRVLAEETSIHAFKVEAM